MADAPQTPPPVDPAELQRSLAEIAEKSAKVISEFVEHQPQAGMMRDLEELGINKAFMELGAKLMADPMKLAEMQMRAWDDYTKLWGVTLSKFLGEATAPVKETPKGDNRFRNEVWQNNFVFDYIKQSYLIAADHIQRAVADAQGLDPNDAKKVKFFTRQYVDALAPTNFVFTNPEVLKTTIDSGGKNLLEGLNHLLGDLERGKGKLAITMTDNSAFTMGENVATTPGKVVFQNDLMQLLQFTPSTPQVDRTPLLITPPWINKYYILDLRAKNSFIKWAVDQGLTVFVISWVNPDGRHAHKTFDDYLFEGPLAAMDAIARITGEPAINLIGYCLGGTLTACLLSWLQKKGQAQRVKSVTFFTTMIDFQEPGELGVFVDDAIVDKLEKRMESRGYLEGAEMAGTFNMMRDNDLIWSFVVNNYLLGKDPFPFDLLYWNSDSTRMPAKMHTFYLRNMYIRNLLREKDALTVGGEKMNLAEVTTPAYFISTIEDHIAPWKSTYAGARRLGGKVRFVLGGSGHIAGIVNPPVAQKYNYWTNDKPADGADAWLATAQRHDGSWWNDWGAWIHGFGGGQVPPRTPGTGALKALEDAPGSYAKLRLDAGEAGAKCAPVTRTPASEAAPVATARESTPATAPAPAAKAVQAPIPAKVPTRTKTPKIEKPPKTAAKAASKPKAASPKKAAKPAPAKSTSPGSPAATISAIFQAQQAAAREAKAAKPAKKKRK
ncbi:MAG: class I poly(R)-hydroxyalkanoic acid synthase [Burkholderiales bacterium]|nr:class I poly(R)-hydroxyalkanoic acid synthase [Burkholderiales bacterium]